MDETRARFLAAIAAQVPAERIAEAHLFAPIRQGGVESGVAVVALEHEPAEAPELAAEVADAEAGVADAEVEVADAEAEGADAEAEVADAEAEVADADAEVADAVADDVPERFTVCTARYKHTLKGPDRGKWEVTVTEEADAPLVTVDAVVRGVQRRSGDVDEIVRLSGDEIRAALPAPAVQKA